MKDIDLRPASEGITLTVVAFAGLLLWTGLGIFLWNAPKTLKEGKLPLMWAGLSVFLFILFVSLHLLDQITNLVMALFPRAK